MSQASIPFKRMSESNDSPELTQLDKDILNPEILYIDQSSEPTQLDIRDQDMELQSNGSDSGSDMVNYKIDFIYLPLLKY
jgi:hypothetical protein